MAIEYFLLSPPFGPDGVTWFHDFRSFDPSRSPWIEKGGFAGEVPH
jgi:hypothetical protein